MFDTIRTFLDSHSIEYDVIEHEPTPTSEDSARARGESMKIGAKALLLKVGDEFILAVLPANRRLDTKALKKLCKSKKLRFANEEELKELTGLEKGAVPPFGNLLTLRMLVDDTLFEEEFMAFNAGSLTTSIKMKTVDYKRVVNPEIARISHE